VALVTGKNRLQRDIQRRVRQKVDQIWTQRRRRRNYYAADFSQK